MSNYTEDYILSIIDNLFERKHACLLLGRGDDCCIFKPDQQHCVSTDMFLEQVHFRLSYFSAYDVGYKALAVNISDIAACGAKPIAFTLNLALPQDMEQTWLQEFFQGMAELANKYKMVLAGGDLSCTDKLYISITVWGESPKDGKFLTRGNCKVNDIIFFVGDIGLSKAGLNLLEEHGRLAIEKWPKACASHLRPVPLVEEAMLISKLAQESNCPLPALMDISDGIFRDLPRLLFSSEHENCYGAELILNEKLLDQELINYCHEYDLNPIDYALSGGEDYALLGACSQSLIPILQNSLPSLKVLGKVTAKHGIICNNNLVPANSGFDHFANL